MGFWEELRRGSFDDDDSGRAKTWGPRISVADIPTFTPSIGEGGEEA